MNGMKISIKIAVTAAALAAAAYAPAQETGRAITLDEAIAVTLTENPAMKAAAYEERAAQQQRRAAIGLRMPQINLTGAYAYLGKDIGFDFNDLKTPVNDLAGKILGSGLIAPELIPSIQGLLNPMMNADWFLTLQDRSLGFVGGEVTLPIWMGGKINAANRAARLNERTAAEQGNQTRNALISELVERYFGLALATQVVAVRQQVADGVRRHLEDARVLEKNGMIARSERLYVEFKMAEAEREGCDMVITHHPIVFHALKRFNSADQVQRCVERAIRGGIALYACHTNLDSAPEGMSWRLAEMLGVGDLRVLQPAQADEKVGFGVVGELPAAVATVEFMRRMQRVLGVRVVRHSDIASPEVRRVAVCTGAGASMIGDARRAGADIYVTADMKYNDFMTPDKALTVADIGHFESEYCAIQILFDILSKNLITFAVRKSESSRNPVNYLV